MGCAGGMRVGGEAELMTMDDDASVYEAVEDRTMVGNRIAAA